MGEKIENNTHKRKVVRDTESQKKQLFKSIPKLLGFFKLSETDGSGCSATLNLSEVADEAGLAQVESGEKREEERRMRKRE